MALQRTATSPFEAVFARHAGPIPQGYLRTLAYKESSFNPAVVHPQSKATGLFQITKTALKGFNDRRGSNYLLAHLKDPELNTQVAVQHLQNVMATYNRLRSLRTDWASPRWVALLTLGWNAGHNALAALASRMEASGIPPERITVDTISQLAKATGKGKYLTEPDRVAWSKSVAAMFLGGGAVPAKDTGPLVAATAPETSGGGGTLVLGLAAVMAVVAAVSKGRTHEPGTHVFAR